jgi:mannosyl-3-phosphoglycerate phosphatase family protein
MLTDSGTLCVLESSAVVNTHVVIFSDVDSVLAAPVAQLREAGAALRILETENVSIVLCSGKTRAELEYVSQEFGIRQPFVCEHGGAAFIPDKYFGNGVTHAREVSGNSLVEFGLSYSSVVQTLHRVAERFGIAIRGFNDMSVEEVARDCGMTPLQARLAKLRDYGEMFRVLDPDESARSRLLRALNAAHLRSILGAEYDHVGGAVDYVPAINLLSTLYLRRFRSIQTIGFASAAASAPLLDFVDFPVLVFASAATAAGAGSPRRGVTTAIATDVCAWVEMVSGAVDGLREPHTLAIEGRVNGRTERKE